MTKRVIQSSIVVLVALFAFACSYKSQKQIVGKWKDVDKAEIVEFSKGGSLSVLTKGASLEGNYKFIDEGRVQIELKGFGSTMFFVNISGDELSLTQPGGAVSRYKRV